MERSFFLRMKCVLAKRNAGLTSGGYKVRITEQKRFSDVNEQYFSVVIMKRRLTYCRKHDDNNIM